MVALRGCTTRLILYGTVNLGSCAADFSETVSVGPT